MLSQRETGFQTLELFLTSERLSVRDVWFETDVHINDRSLQSSLNLGNCLNEKSWRTDESSLKEFFEHQLQNFISLSLFYSYHSSLYQNISSSCFSSDQLEKKPISNLSDRLLNIEWRTMKALSLHPLHEQQLSPRSRDHYESLLARDTRSKVTANLPIDRRKGESFLCHHCRHQHHYHPHRFKRRFTRLTMALLMLSIVCVLSLFPLLCQSAIGNMRLMEKRILDQILGNNYDPRIRPSGLSNDTMEKGESMFILSRRIIICVVIQHVSCLSKLLSALHTIYRNNYQQLCFICITLSSLHEMS
jgi:hypothetical protein